MIERIREASPSRKARTAGILYLLIFIAAPSGAATATATKMLATLTCDTAVALIFYDLFKPVSAGLSLLALVSRLILVAVMAVSSLNYLGNLGFLQPAHSAAAFNAGYQLALVPFGVHCVLIGYLIIRSTFLPRILGALVVFAGLGWLTFVWPPLANYLYPYILAPGILGEGSLTLWLLVMGVNAQRWQARADVAGQRRTYRAARS